MANRKHRLRFGTWNVPILYELTKLSQATREMQTGKHTCSVILVLYLLIGSHSFQNRSWNDLQQLLIVKAHCCSILLLVNLSIISLICYSTSSIECWDMIVHRKWVLMLFWSMLRIWVKCSEFLTYSGFCTTGCNIPKTTFLAYELWH